MSLSQVVPYPLPAGTSSQITTPISSTNTGRTCCENGRPIMTDPHTGQTICSCQYNPTLLGYSRLPGIPDGVYGSSAYAAQGFVPLGSESSAFYSPLGNSPYDIKEATEAWRSLTQPGACFPYDPAMAVYPYGPGYGGIDLNARRKNATRETTNTLKAWLYEHRKNPYPTKGEKIMLAIITKMTLTQVSTWFANARRRLKKENKMTWSPRNRSEDDADNDDIDNDDDNDNLDDLNKTDDDDAIKCKSDTNSEILDLQKKDTEEKVSEKIISVDDDEDDDDDDSNLSLRGISVLNNDGENSYSDSDCLSNNMLRREAEVNSPNLSIGDDSRSSDLASPSCSSANECNPELVKNKSNMSSARDHENPNRAKIWSVSQFLKSSTESEKDEEDKKENVSRSRPTLFQNGTSDFYYLSSVNTNMLRNGRFGGFGPYPSALSLSHTTLSYPYILSSHNSAKSTLARTCSAFSDAEHLSKSVEKHVRSQSSIFSPARDIDVMSSEGKL